VTFTIIEKIAIIHTGMSRESLMAPCQSCHAGCCRSFAVPITGADIVTIERRSGLSFWDFACRWADPEGKIARGRVPHFFFPDAPDTPFVICLIQTHSLFLPGTVKCRFLVECPPDQDHPLGQARCGIYHGRPAACRVFPTKMNTTGDLVVLCNVPPKPRDDAHPAYDLCPREWEAHEVDPVQGLQDLVLTKYEFAFFAEIARAWNKSPKAWDAFPEFLRIVYSHRVQRESEMDADLIQQEAAHNAPTYSTNRDAA
jgi:Fe-S-cluster containining protein